MKSVNVRKNSFKNKIKRSIHASIERKEDILSKKEEHKVSFLKKVFK